MKQYKVILIGAGGRGEAYAELMKKMPEQYQLVGVAEPIKERRENIRKMFEIPKENCCEDWQLILDKTKFADIVVIATMDRQHYAPAMKAIEMGYDLLLEKPIAPTVQECRNIAVAAKNKGVKVLVCHVLRYTPFYKTVKKIIMDGVVGDIMSVIAVEGVGNLHYSHSFARGDWHREDETTPMILAKCCHDLDIIQWLVDKSCKKVSSFGELTHFTEENAPAGAPHRCIGEKCPAEKTCPYHYKKVYLQEDSRDFMRRAASRGFTKEFWPTDDEVIKGLENTNFGACVYYADNNVVDHQVVNMEFEGGATASLTMNAFNKGGRYIRIFGTKGELYAQASATEIEVYTYDDKVTKKISVEKTEESISGGHGGGDAGIISEMYDYLQDEYHGYCAADIETSVKNHMIGFAAEKARLNNIVVNMDEFDETSSYM